MRQILGESDAAIGQWRDALREALGPNGQLMVNLIAQLELVIGPQAPMPDLASQEVQGRFQLVFRRFLGVFARQEHPLLLFLDDLQWVDAGTLSLLTDLLTHPDVHYLLLIGAYRDNEVDSGHRLMHSLETIRQTGRTVQNIALAPLALDDVARLVAESMHCPPAEAKPLAQLVLDKTNGNPFFTRQFLTSLAEEKLLRFDASHSDWKWDLPRVHAKGYTENVVDLMVGKLARLPQELQDALAQFACVGHAADAATLGLVLGQTMEAVHALLWEAEQAGLVWRQENSFTILHDRVQEAAYSLIPADSRAEMHLRIGRLLACGLSSVESADRIFEVVSQLNRGSGLVESQEELERIAELNLLAGQHAKTATAYTSALACFAAAAALLTEDSWEQRHELMFQVDLNRAECEFLTGALAEADERLAALSTHAVTTAEKATMTGLRVDLYTTLDQSDRAIAVGLDYLRQLGIDWSLHPTVQDVRHEYENIFSQIGSRKIEEPRERTTEHREAGRQTAHSRIDKALDGEAPASSLSKQQSLAVDTLKAILRSRGDSDVAVEMAGAVAAERFQRPRVYVGKLIEHGVAPYENNPDNADNYYVRLHTPNGARTVWGVDLPRALEHGEVKTGDVNLVQLKRARRFHNDWAARPRHRSARHFNGAKNGAV